MRKVRLTLAIMVLASLLGSPALAARGTLDGFLGIPFGSSPDHARRLMLSRAGTSEESSTTGDSKMYFHGPITGYADAYLRLTFDESGLIQGATLISAKDPEVEYTRILLQLVDEFGVPNFARKAPLPAAQWVFKPVPNGPTRSVLVTLHAQQKLIMVLYSDDSRYAAYEKKSGK